MVHYKPIQTDIDRVSGLRQESWGLMSTRCWAKLLYLLRTASVHPFDRYGDRITVYYNNLWFLRFFRGLLLFKSESIFFFFLRIKRKFCRIVFYFFCERHLVFNSLNGINNCLRDNVLAKNGIDYNLGGYFSKATHLSY